ncbi:hypothetical protein KPSA3_03807 [Pseudomonas syringae pv. actinidiae]|uniref:Uncharacterized protein n=1 Tax=Pseudomonas syringae pv. actinidiae TaxID=103796 RepID=A0AAN4Q5S9_PSESF|nr:hypothetical protein KPSA3_03807 [Pseudomonas syringae pv. actinidiae]
MKTRLSEVKTDARACSGCSTCKIARFGTDCHQPLSGYTPDH